MPLQAPLSVCSSFQQTKVPVSGACGILWAAHKKSPLSLSAFDSSAQLLLWWEICLSYLLSFLPFTDWEHLCSTSHASVTTGFPRLGLTHPGDSKTSSGPLSYLLSFKKFFHLSSREVARCHIILPLVFHLDTVTGPICSLPGTRLLILNCLLNLQQQPADEGTECLNPSCGWAALAITRLW